MIKYNACARLIRLLFWQLPENPYPSNHPWSLRHDLGRSRG
jgi:hypothetical protein